MQNNISCEMLSIVVEYWSSAAFFRILLLRTKPLISSILSPIRGIRPNVMIGVSFITSPTLKLLSTVFITRRGVITSPTIISLRRRRFCITNSSSFSITLLSSAMSASTANSVRVTSSVVTFGRNDRRICIVQTNIHNTNISMRSTVADGTVSLRQYKAPIVLGKISLNRRIAIVSMAEATATLYSGYTFCTSYPTPSAPTV